MGSEGSGFIRQGALPSGGAFYINRPPVSPFLLIPLHKLTPEAADSATGQHRKESTR